MMAKHFFGSPSGLSGWFAQALGAESVNPLQVKKS